MKERPVTLSDVASHAGVSPMTVSRVINGETNVRESTKQRVLASVEALHYTPNLSARALAGNRTYKFALLYGNPSAFYLSELLVGALEAISKRGHQLLVHKVSESASADAILESLSIVTGQYDGVIVPAPMSDYEAVRDFLFSNDMPSAFLSGDEGKGRSCKICIDNYRAAKEITTHLIDLGHRRIGFVKGPPNHFSSAERLRGFKDALAEHSVKADRMLIAPGLFTFESGFKAAKKLLSSDNPPTAVFASNDDMAAGVLAHAASIGLNAPNKLSVVGFDDSPVASAVFPRLTTVKQPLSKMAEAAVDSLMALVSGSTEGDLASRRIMEHRIVFGASTGPPPGA